MTTTSQSILTLVRVPAWELARVGFYLGFGFACAVGGSFAGVTMIAMALRAIL